MICLFDFDLFPLAQESSYESATGTNIGKKNYLKRQSNIKIRNGMNEKKKSRGQEWFRFRVL